MSGWKQLPVIALADWPPADWMREAWIEHYRRCIERDGADRFRAALEWEQRDEHPYIRGFHLEMLELAIGSGGAGVVSVQRPDRPLTQREAQELIDRYGTSREAARHSAWEQSHIYRVAKGERGKEGD